MTVNRRKKNSRQRGSHTHGWGSKKKHRGSGNRGGKGMAGSGKRADSKKPSFWKERYFGKLGFTSRLKKGKSINLKTISLKKDRWLSEGLINKKGDLLMIDLTKLGYDKLLGDGRIDDKFEINVKHASKKAIESIKKVKGKIILQEARVKENGTVANDNK